jgi:predicted HAD superfamily phosphohydrolase YqeG
MSEIPVSTNDLDDIVYKVVRDVIEDKAINGVVEDMDEKLIKEVTQDVIFIIDSYMGYINEAMNKVQLLNANQSKINLE